MRSSTLPVRCQAYVKPGQVVMRAVTNQAGVLLCPEGQRVGDQTLTAVITRDAVNELKLRRGDEALAIVKSTEVMIARPAAE